MQFHSHVDISCVDAGENHRHTIVGDNQPITSHASRQEGRRRIQVCDPELVTGNVHPTVRGQSRPTHRPILAGTTDNVTAHEDTSATIPWAAPDLRSVERIWPLMERKEVTQSRRLVATEDDLGIQVGWFDLANELPAPPTGRQYIQRTSLALPHSDDPGDPVLAGCDHGRDGGVFGTEPCPRTGVYTYACVERAPVGSQRTADVTKQPVTDATWVEYRSGSVDQVLVGRGDHELTLPTGLITRRRFVHTEQC